MRPFVLAAITVATLTAQAPLDLAAYRLHRFYRGDFRHAQRIATEETYLEQSAGGAWRRKSLPDPRAEWIVEGRAAITTRNGSMTVSPEHSHVVIWNRTIMPADFLLEYDMRPEGSTNGLTIVFFCATGKNGEDLFALPLPARRADYPAYHSGEIANYSDAYWSRNTEEEAVSNRLRKNPGFALVAQGPSLTTGPTTVAHHVRILKSGAHIEVEINRHVVLRWDDPGQPLGAGRIGLRSMEALAKVSYSHFRVWKITRR